MVARGAVTNFEASDGDPSLSNHQVRLTWDEEPDADSYTLQRRDYDLDSESWSWTTIYSPPSGTTSYVDTAARYSGTADPISYRIRAHNTYGNSPSWSTDTGYPKPRRVGIAFYCAADNSSGGNAVVQWSIATADFSDCNSFWNDYGFEYVMANSGSFYWMTTAAYRNLTLNEPEAMHAAYGRVQHPNSICVYYAATYDGDPNMAFDWAICPGTLHNTLNTFIVMCQYARTGCTGGQTLDIVLPHECGHAVTRHWDVYLMDLDGNGIMDDGADCSINTWCNGQWPYSPSEIPVMFCDINATYPEEPNSWSKIPKNLMWYSYCGCAVTQYDLTVGQYIYGSKWVMENESNYPMP
jgi:hypothetical protein